MSKQQTELCECKLVCSKQLYVMLLCIDYEELWWLIASIFISRHF